MYTFASESKNDHSIGHDFEATRRTSVRKLWRFWSVSPYTRVGYSKHSSRGRQPNLFLWFQTVNISSSLLIVWTLCKHSTCCEAPKNTTSNLLIDAEQRLGCITTIRLWPELKICRRGDLKVFRARVVSRWSTKRRICILLSSMQRSHSVQSPELKICNQRGCHQWS